ncbi:MAG: M48 family metalloprotease [Candidatus Eremiobacteraeota bacterium]|nr:M48 family metalloprotease [Candidatus Eremiobacteraeota bacterium]
MTANRVLCCTALVGSLALAPGIAKADEPTEAQMGAQLFTQLKSQGEIVKSSPLYDTLRPIAAAITKAVQPRYEYPIHFYIVHENQPNAFAAPGGNIYVVDSLLYFVKNTEELAGTLCHESSHLLHHDSMAVMKHNEEIRRRALAATILLGPSIAHILTLEAIGQLDANHYSRGAEEAADLTGADTCASAGYNPWGLVWLFSDFSNAQLKAPPEILSDHPNDAHRIECLKSHFAANPATFARFSSDPKTAKPLRVPKNEQEQFLRP